MEFTRAEAYAPATMANLGVGFDVLGLAFQDPGDTVIAERADTPGVIIAAIEGDDGKLPLELERNTAGVAARSTLRLAGVGERVGVRLTIHKGLPRASGLGSSAASAVAAALAVNALLGEPLTRAELLPACLDGEAVASGYHVDNIAPCLFGGITLAYGIRAHEIVSLPIPDGLQLALVTPNVEVATREARAVLPTDVPLKAMVAQTAQIARLIDAIYRGDIPAMAAAMEADGIIEPARFHLMPKLAAARVVAKAAGAYGLVISGAGPTLCAVCADAEVAARVALALGALYDDAGIGGVARCTPISVNGARVLAVC
ncbi:MAG: homoserine kinase [Chloroflexota bacterium]|nr:homoserine kinase [Chloroflexota bacterium]